MDRHSWLESEKESEAFKDPVDCTRIFLAGLGKKGFVDGKNEIIKYDTKAEEKTVGLFLDKYPNIGLA